MQCCGSELVGRTLLERTVVSGILVALMRHTLLVLMWHMPLVVRLRKLAFLTVCGSIRMGGMMGTKLRVAVRATVRPSSVSLSNVFGLARKQKCDFDIPVV